MEDAKEKFLKILLFCCVGFLLYSGVQHAPFTFDDDVIVARNLAIRDLHWDWASIYKLWEFQPSRFLTNLTFAVNFSLGELDPYGYHLGNILIHLLVSLGVWYLTHLVARSRIKEKLPVDVPFWAGLIFLVHPLQTESVSYIAQRCTALMGLFYVTSLIFFIQGRNASNFRGRSLFYGATFISAAAAILSKEIAISLPIAWLTLDYFLFSRKPRLSYVWIFVATITAVAWTFGFKIIKLMTQGYLSQSHRGDYLTLWTYLLTQLKVCIVFLKLIIFPLSLNIDYDFPMVRSILEPAALAALFFLIAMGVVAYRQRKNNWILAFGISWFFVSLFGHIFPARANVIAEHKLYLTLMLVLPLAVLGVSRHMRAGLFYGLMGIIVVVLSFLTLERNKAWADPVLLWTDTAAKSPNKPRAYLTLGVSYFQTNDFKKAMENYERVIDLAPEYYQVYANIAEIKARERKFDEAIGWINKAIALKPDFDAGYFQRAVLLELLGRPSDAVRDYDVWLHHHSDDLGIMAHKADIYFKNKYYVKALEVYDAMIAQRPVPFFYQNRAVIHRLMGNVQKAIEDELQAKRLK